MLAPPGQIVNWFLPSSALDIKFEPGIVDRALDWLEWLGYFSFFDHFVLLYRLDDLGGLLDWRDNRLDFLNDLCWVCLCWSLLHFSIFELMDRKRGHSRGSRDGFRNGCL